MDNPPLHWIRDLLPLIALLLVSAFMVAHRHRRDTALQSRRVRKPSGPAFTEFSARSAEMAKFRATSANDTSNGDAWNALHSRLTSLSELEHARLLALSERGQWGAAETVERYRGVGVYESARHATDHGDLR